MAAAVNQSLLPPVVVQATSASAGRGVRTGSRQNLQTREDWQKRTGLSLERAEPSIERVSIRASTRAALSTGSAGFGSIGTSLDHLAPDELGGRWVPSRRRDACPPPPQPPPPPPRPLPPPPPPPPSTNLTNCHHYYDDDDHHHHHY